MIEMVIWLVVIAVFVFRALKQNGTLDELFAGAKKRKENQAERVVYEQPEEGSGKKEKKKGPGIRVPKHTGFAVTMVVIVLAAAVLSFDSFYTLSEEEMAVVTTFGKPAVEEASGLHFKIPVIQRVTKVSKAITGMQIGYTTDPARADGASIDNPVSIENESLMITKDFNLTNVDFYVEYMVTDPVQAVRHRSVYESIIKNLAQSYIRDTVGVYNVDDASRKISDMESTTCRFRIRKCREMMWRMRSRRLRMRNRAWRRRSTPQRNISLRIFRRRRQRPISFCRMLRHTRNSGSTRQMDRWRVSRTHTRSM